MSSEASLPVDGRRARRERSREAVIDSIFALVTDGEVPPSVEQVADRSGVSVSSIFRMFDGLDDMRNQALEQFEVRYARLLELDVDASAPRSERILRFVRARVALYSEAGPLMRMARQRSLDHAPFANSVSAQRTILAAQTQRCLRPETSTLTPAEAANLMALVDATTSPEAFEVLGAEHARTRRQIEQTWRRAVAALITSWCCTSTVSSTMTATTMEVVK
jgi:TetR/AcrR family transcriptional regulator of autoinduction and epiphytic fitness